MKEFKNFIKDLEFAIGSVILFERFLIGIVMLLSIILLFTIFRIPIMFSLIPSVIAILIFLKISLSKNKIKIAEKTFNPLNEKLSAAYDNMNRKSLVIEKLQEEIIKSAKEMRLSFFINNRKNTLMLLGCFILSVLIVYATYFGFRVEPYSFQKFMPEYNFDLFYKGAFSDAITGGQPSAAQGSGNEDIFGEKAVAELGEEPLILELNSKYSEMSIRKTEEISKPDYFKDSFPTEIEIDSSEALEENIPAEYQEIIKSYFKNLK